MKTAKYDGVMFLDREIAACCERHGLDTVQVTEMQIAANEVVQRVLDGEPRIHPDGRVVKVSGLTTVEDTE